MIDGVTQEAPSTDGVNWSDGHAVMQYQLSQNEWIRAMVEAIARKANEPRYITMPDGTSLADMAKDRPWTGVVYLLDTTLSEAYRQCAKRGFRVMDGSGGTQDMRGLFVRGAATGAGAGATGGCTEADINLTIDNHAVHTHTATSGGPSASTCPLVTCVTGPQAGTNAHTHTITVANNAAEQVHSFNYDPAAIIPPYYAMLFARKM
jgi:hypothetical protein